MFRSQRIRMLCLTFSALAVLSEARIGQADELFEGRVVVNGKVEAKQIEVAGRPVVTVPMLEQAAKDIKSTVIEELTRQLRTNSNSYITKEFSDQIASRVIESIGRSRTETNSLSKHLDLDVKNLETRLRDSEQVITQLKADLVDRDRELNTMKRDIDELKRALSRLK